MFFLGTIAGGFAQEAGGCPTIFSAYDKNNRLIREQIKVGQPFLVVQRDTSYTYDSANNRTARTVNGAATDYAYNALNQLTGTTGAEVAGYTYDLAGNRLTRTGAGNNATYAYDQENRLTSLTDATGTYAYAYDYRTRRVTRTENGATTRILFSGGTSCSELALDAQTLSASAPSCEYIRGSDMGGGIGGILYTVRAGVPSYTHYNSRGDVTAKTNTTGLATYTAQYEAFGKRTFETGNTADRQRANTKDEDPTGLLNEGYRYRDLTTGTFLTRDPAGFIDGPNLYAYVIQNPWTAFDPEGLAFDSSTFDSENNRMKNWSELDEKARTSAAFKNDEYDKRVSGFNKGLAKLRSTPFGSAEYEFLKTHKMIFSIMLGDGYRRPDRSFVRDKGYTVSGFNGDSFEIIAHEFTHLIQNTGALGEGTKDTLDKNLTLIRSGIFINDEDWKKFITLEDRPGWKEAQAQRALNIVQLEYQIMFVEPEVQNDMEDPYPLKTTVPQHGHNGLYPGFDILTNRGTMMYNSEAPRNPNQKNPILQKTSFNFKHAIAPTYKFEEALKKKYKSQ